MDAVVDRGGGNPFFLQQLAHAAAAGGHAPQVPRSVSEAIRQRVAGLPEECQPPLQVLAVAGRHADIAVLADVAGLGRTGLLAVLAPALSAGLLIMTDLDQAVQFTHVLVQQTLYDGLDPDRRAHLHERLAGRLAADVARRPQLTAAVADHALRATRAGRGGALSPREQDVLDLLAAGATTRPSANNSSSASTPWNGTCATSI